MGIVLSLMKIIKNILIIRAGVSERNRIEHPLHCPPPLSLKYAQAILEQERGCTVRIIDCLAHVILSDAILEVIANWPADLVVVSIDSPAFKNGISLCQSIKKHHDIFIVIVGSDVTERYQAYLCLNSTFDIIIRGEFELEIGFLVKRLNESNDIEKIKEYYNYQKIQERLLIDDLDALPSLKWDKGEIKKYPYIYPLRFKKRILAGYVSTSRGCPHACTFCSPSVRKSYGKKLRLRSVIKVVDEMEALNKSGINVISFEDDDFTVSKDHVLSLCDEMKRRGLNIKWACHARTDEVTPHLLKAMKEAGCMLLLFGIESGSQRILNVLHKLSTKADWIETSKCTFNSARTIGIATCAMFMIGNPTESEKDVDDSIRLACELKPDLVKVHFFTLYPGSIDYEEYRDKCGEIVSQHHYLNPITNLSNMDDSTLRKVQLKFYRKFLFRPSFAISHFLKYLLYYLMNLPDSWRLLKEGVVFLIFSGKPTDNQKSAGGSKTH